MTNRLNTGASRLAARMSGRASTTVTYARGGTSASVQTVVGTTHFSFVDAVGQDQHIHSRDFLIARSDLVSTFGDPDRGDRIRMTTNEGVDIYEVMAPNGEPHWRWSDQFNVTLRIHTKYIKTEVVS